MFNYELPSYRRRRIIRIEEKGKKLSLEEMKKKKE
jgi:hypothetical protein